jgi:hypothetical protein
VLLKDTQHKTNEWTKEVQRFRQGILDEERGLEIMMSCEDKGLLRAGKGSKFIAVAASRPNSNRAIATAWPGAKSRKGSFKVPCIDSLHSNQTEAHLMAMVCGQVTDS